MWLFIKQEGEKGMDEAINLDLVESIVSEGDNDMGYWVDLRFRHGSDEGNKPLYCESAEIADKLIEAIVDGLGDDRKVLRISDPFIPLGKLEKIVQKAATR